MTPGSANSSGKSMVSLVGIGLALVALIWLFNQRFETIGPVSPAIGKPFNMVRLFEATSGDAKPVDRDDLRGKVVLIDFWATWCPPCVREFPDFLTLNSEFGSDPNFRFYSVEADLSGKQANDDKVLPLIKEFLDRQHTDLPIFGDVEQTTFNASCKAAEQDPSQGVLPTTVLLDQQGVIRGYWEGGGPQKLKQIRQLLKELLKAPG